ncbi:MAG TPA: hypothetical protein VFD48_09190, partial [Pyrinomonadaceae bacterium]|nr:hypothetical protein [Pyrinomonadaceae bacterium]
TPKAPWGQPGSPFALPWTEVLDYACLEAKDATTADEAAAKLTRWIYSLGDNGTLDYDYYGSGSSNYTIPGQTTFRCTRFLQLLAGGPAPRNVNCTDCATILSSFANILGCDLTQSRIGSRFLTNRIELIGSASPISTSFNFHEVAWEFPSMGMASLYDCCLRVDGDANPADSNFSMPILGTDTPLGTPGSGGYHFRLIAAASNGSIPGEMKGTRVRRKIDGQTTTTMRLDPGQRRQLEKEYAFGEWDGSTQECGAQYKEEVMAQEEGSISGERLFLKNYSFEKVLQPPAGWIARDVEVLKSEPDPFRLTEVIWRSRSCSGATLRVVTYECSSISAARSFLLTLLGQFNMPGIKRRLSFIVGDKPVKIGDVAFAGRDDLVVLFARANNVILLQNVGRTFIPASQFAAGIDADMTSIGRDPKMENVAELNQFYVSDKGARVGEAIRILTKSKNGKKDKEPLLRFFTPGGQVFLKGDDLLYRPLVAGEQSITVLAEEADGKTAGQVLRLAKVSAASYGTKCTNPDPNKEVTVMPDITGMWSSIRPQNDGDNTDMTPEGYIEITGRNPGTGEITGSYRDPARTVVQDIHGRVSFILPNSFRIAFSHPVTEGITRYYEGQLVAIDDNDDFGVQIVAGRYSDVFDEPPLLAAGATDSATAVSGGQANGTWVATKP